MKRNDLKKILSVAIITTMCVAVTACGQVSASSSDSTDTVITQESTTEGNEKSSEKPDGEAPDGAPGEKPDGEAPGNPPEGGGGFGGGSSSADIDYQGAVVITSSDSQDVETYASSTADESALLISTSDDVTIKNATVTKTGDSDGGDNCNFYGLNAAVLVKDGSTTTIRAACNHTNVGCSRKHDPKTRNGSWSFD